MRQENRIPIISDILYDNKNKYKLLMNWGIESEEILENWCDRYGEFIEFWESNPDLRLPQVLINLGIMPNFGGFYYHKEDEDSMIESGLIDARDILFWGINYTKDNKPLDETAWTLIADMNTDHISTIVSLINKRKMAVSPVYTKYFREELKLRRNGK